VPSYVCDGTTKTVVASRPVVGTGIPMANLAAVRPGYRDHLLLTVRLPRNADARFQGRTSLLELSITATSRH
jgi:spore coat-associated protein N